MLQREYGGVDEHAPREHPEQDQAVAGRGFVEVQHFSGIEDLRLRKNGFIAT